MSEVRIKLRNDLASQWAIINPVLTRAELGVEYDTGQFKIGDGVTLWNNLPYWSDQITPGSSIVSVGVTEPPSPVAGELWVDTGNNEFKVYQNGTWEAYVTKSELASSAGLIDINAGYF